MTQPRALVTGATGFVGSHLVRHLLGADWQVHVIVRPQSSRSMMAGANAIRIHEHTGRMDSMLAILAQAKPDVVFHLASLFLSDHKPPDIDALIHSNIVFGTQLVEAMTDVGATSLVNTGTAWQHYQGHEFSPVNLYAATKQAFEALLQYYIEVHEMRVITLNLHDTYGPGDTRPKLINLLRRVALEDQSLAMSPGEQRIDLVHVDDVVSAFETAGHRLMSDQVTQHEHYSVSSGVDITLKEVVTEVERILERSLPIMWGGRPYRGRETMQPWTGEILPGWKPVIDLHSGLRSALEDCVSFHAKGFGKTRDESR